MKFEWDENKCLLNIEKHELDFSDADLLFEGPILEAEAKTVRNERRWLAIGMIDDLVVTVIFTRRGEAVRLLSMRRASRGERARYKQLFEAGP